MHIQFALKAYSLYSNRFTNVIFHNHFRITNFLSHIQLNNTHTLPQTEFAFCLKSKLYSITVINVSGWWHVIRCWLNMTRLHSVSIDELNLTTQKYRLGSIIALSVGGFALNESMYVFIRALVCVFVELIHSRFLVVEYSESSKSTNSRFGN